MGSSTQYYEDDEPTFHRRYTPRGQGYAISHDRDISHHDPYLEHRNHSHNTRNIPESEPSSSSVRRRIPVAVSGLLFAPSIQLSQVIPSNACIVWSLQKTQDSLQWRSWQWWIMYQLQICGTRTVSVSEGRVVFCCYFTIADRILM